MTPTRKDVEPTTSATDELRRLLDEHGVEYETYIEQPTGFEHVKWNFSEHGSADFNLEFGEPWLTMYGVISGPAQAIAATLGSEDTYTREDVEGAFVSGYSLGLDMFDSSKPEKGWEQNKRNLDEEMEDLGWVRKDTATLSAGTCHEVEDEDTGFIVCSECGAVHDTDYTNYYCWCCGRKVVEE